MTVSSPVAKKRSDYQTPDFLISHVDMVFHLDVVKTRVITTSQITRNGQHDRPLVLDGESIKLVSFRCVDFTAYCACRRVNKQHGLCG